jgi:hypothetical protein
MKPIRCSLWNDETASENIRKAGELTRRLHWSGIGARDVPGKGLFRLAQRPDRQASHDRGNETIRGTQPHADPASSEQSREKHIPCRSALTAWCGMTTSTQFLTSTARAREFAHEQ